MSGRFVEIRVWNKGKELLLLLFTTDMTATHEELAALYRKRWDIEISHPDYPSSGSLYRGRRAA